MPNNVKNMVRMEGIAELPYFKAEKNVYTDEIEWSFDFNKLIPMPDELNIECGGREEEAIRAALCKIKSGIENGFGLYSLKNTVNVNEDSVRKNIKNARRDFDEMAKLGMKYIENAVNYGFVEWYSWRCKYWGTKWGGYRLEIIDKDVIRFETAWSAPEPIIRKLAEMYPDKKIEHKWADEDRGHNSGYRVYYNGDVAGGPDEDIQESYQRYIECWGESECLYQDKDGLWHEYDCDECPNNC